MLSSEQFRDYAHKVVEWITDYWKFIDKYPVKSQVKPGEIYNQLPAQAPEEAESMGKILADFERIIIPGITHWQSPNFYGYFPANSSFPSLLAEMLTSALGAQCMIWETSPAAAELEERVMNWLIDMIGLPKEWEGVIQSTASDATLAAILSAREKFSQYRINEAGFDGTERFRIYCSSQTHSSIDKAVKIAGIGKINTVHISVDHNFAMNPAELEKAIHMDISAGYKPLCVIANIGTTSSTAVDPVAPIARICNENGIWLHVDAAYVGSALILPEYQYLIEGIEDADSFVFNPHKWLFTNFDCSAYFVKDKKALTRTFEILPEYLKTGVDQEVNNYRDWGIPLGRRFRALKLWFVIRNYGVKGLQETLRKHIQLAQHLSNQIRQHPDFEVVAPTLVNLVCFRYRPVGIKDQRELENLNRHLKEELNASGRMYLTHTKLNDNYTLRIVIGQTYVEEEHVQASWEFIQETAEKIRIPNT